MESETFLAFSFIADVEVCQKLDDRLVGWRILICSGYRQSSLWRQTSEVSKIRNA